MKRWKLYPIALVLLVTTMFVLAQNQNDEEAIRDLATQWEEMFNQGDFQGVADMYTEDARLSGYEGDVYEGRDEILVYLEDPLPVEGAQLHITPADTQVAGDMASGWGTYAFTAPDDTLMLEGNYLITLERVNGEWLIRRHLSNMVLPEDMEGAAGGQN